MHSSDSVLSLSLIFSLFKVVVCASILVSYDGNCSKGLLWWIIGSLVFDIIYAIHVGVRIPIVKKIARGEMDREPCIV
jgi:hypothetical protein